MDGLAAYASERDRFQCKLSEAEDDMFHAMKAFGGDPHSCLDHFDDAAYSAYLEARSRLVEFTRERDKMSEGAYQLAGKLQEVEEEHGRHVRLLATALKRYGMWPIVCEEG